MSLQNTFAAQNVLQVTYHVVRFSSKAVHATPVCTSNYGDGLTIMIVDDDISMAHPVLGPSLTLQDGA